MKRFRLGDEDQMGSIINLANVLVLLSRGGGGGGGGGGEERWPSAGRVFECKTCNRRFPSFQALGGHRASHKKPRLIEDEGGQGGQQVQRTAAKTRAHECSICGLEFAVGQALGGHMRRHRAATSHGWHGVHQVSNASGSEALLSLDLNLPPRENYKEGNSMVFGIDHQLVDKTPMVDFFH